MNSGSAVVVPVPDPIDRESNKERGATDYLPGDTGLRNHPGGSNVPPSSGCLGFLRSESTDTALHETIKGYCTAQSRTDWCKYHGIMFESVRITKCLNADRNPKAPLYYWQLFSLIGVDMIKALITDFYEIVFADSDAAWFRDVFVKNGDVRYANCRVVYRVSIEVFLFLFLCLTVVCLCIYGCVVVHECRLIIIFGCNHGTGVMRWGVVLTIMGGRTV